jgi:hypothetical protein
MVAVGSGRQVRDLVQQVVTLGGEVESIAARVTKESAEAGAGEMGASFQQGQVGQAVPEAIWRGKVKCLEQRGQEASEGCIVWRRGGRRPIGVGHPSPPVGTATERGRRAMLGSGLMPHRHAW